MYVPNTIILSDDTLLTCIVPTHAYPDPQRSMNGISEDHHHYQPGSGPWTLSIRQHRFITAQLIYAYAPSLQRKPTHKLFD